MPKNEIKMLFLCSFDFTIQINRLFYYRMEDTASGSLVVGCLDGHGLYGDKLSQVYVWELSVFY